MYQHLFFDLDRTLWDFQTNSHQAITELALKYKLKEQGIDSVEAFIVEYHRINDHMWDLYGQGLIDKETLRYGRFQQALEKFQIRDQQLTLCIGNDYSSLAPYKTSLVPNTMDVLNYLSTKYTLHIITNGFEEVQHIKMKNCGIDKFFSEVITSERAGYKKPDPRIFEYSLSVTRASRENSLMIGDNLNADVLGARKAGLRQVYFNPEGEKHSEEITHEISDLKELMKLL